MVKKNYLPYQQTMLSHHIKFNYMEKNLTVNKSISSIQNLENAIKSLQSSKVVSSKKELAKVAPLNHTFAEGIYAREISIPRDTIVVGAIHKKEHISFLLSGEGIFITEKGQERLKAPCTIVSSAGSRKAVYAVTDLVFTNVCLNPKNIKNIDELEDYIVCENIEEYEKYLINESKKIIN